VSTLVIPKPVLTGDIGWYAPASFDATQLKQAADTAPFLIFKGKPGVARANDLRSLGVSIEVVVDPSQYEAAKVRKGKVDRAGWDLIETSANAARLVSPGAFLDEGITPSLANHMVESEVQWVASNGGDAYASVCLDAHTLRDQTAALIDILGSADCDIWLTLSHRNDPLSLDRTVQALVELVRAVPRIALMRADIAAIGALAFGAATSSIGLIPSLRHSPDGGGGIGNAIPVVFVRTLLSFKKGDLLEAWVQRDADVENDLRCPEWCCENASLVRFADPAMGGLALVHNMVALRAVIDDVLAVDVGPLRQKKFLSLAKIADYQHDRLRDYVDTIKAEAQLRQWARLG
jgi:hypothetical protein